MEILIGTVIGAALAVGCTLGRWAFGPRANSGSVRPKPPLRTPPPPSIPPNPASPRPPIGGSGQACACCHCCHPPTTGQWIRPAWLKTVDIMSRKGEQ